MQVQTIFSMQSNRISVHLEPDCDRFVQMFLDQLFVLYPSVIGVF